MHPAFRKLFIFFVGIVLIGVMGAGAAVGALLAYIDNLPPLDALENYSPPEISRVYDRTGTTQIAEISAAERRELVNIADIPSHVKNAFIAIEDERFAKHFGIDLEGIARAIFVNFKSGGRAQGASTITMQVARNVVLQNTKKTFTRKINEILTALQIERKYSKDQILQFYVNHVFFGAQSYGVQAASRTYFNKDVKDLTVPEAAMIAGLPQAPSNLNPFSDAERARDRRNLVLKNMRKLDYIRTDPELDRYLASPIELNPAPPRKTAVPYFVDYVRSFLMRQNSMRDKDELAGRGFTIISSVDLNLQRIVEEELSKGLRGAEKEIESQKEERFASESSNFGSPKKGQIRLARIKEVKDESIVVSLGGYTTEITLPKTLPFFNPEDTLKPGKLIDIIVLDISSKKLDACLTKSHVQGAAVLLDAHTGEILALAGGDDFNDNANSGQWNRAVQGGRQPGSCWKPLLYGASFDVNDAEGKPRFTPGHVINDQALDLPGYSPKNYEGKHYGSTALYEALVKSRNIPTIKLFLEIGARKAVPLYQKYNMVTIPSDWDLDPVPSMPLGTPDITPLALAGAYAVFANAGMGIQPSPIKRLSSAKSPNDSRTAKPEKSQVLTPQAAYMTTRILQDVVAMGTAKTTVGKWMDEQKAGGRKLPEVAAKTGTTNECKAAWLTGFTPDLVLAIYVSFDQNRSMGPKMVGGRTVGPIWVPMMDRILRTREDWKMKFDVPADIEFCDICSKSGKRVTSSCYASGQSVFKNAAFKKGTAPKDSCDYHSGTYAAEPGSEGDVEGNYRMQPQTGEQQQQPQQNALPQGYQYYQGNQYN